MSRKRWYAYSGILQRRLSESTEVIATVWQVVGFGAILGTFASFDEAQAFLDTQNNFTRRTSRIVETQVTETSPAVSKAKALVPLTPLPVFARPGKVLTTRGFWDVTSVTSPRGIVSNFAFGMIFLPTKLVYDQIPVEQGRATRYDLQALAVNFPDPLLDDPGWFCYDSFVRVTTDVNQDPPFHSKSQHRFSENTTLCVIAGVEVAVENLQSLQLNFGIRFRMLVEH